jgi:hypothetical protein
MSGPEDLDHSPSGSDPQVRAAVASAVERFGHDVAGVGEGRTPEGSPCVVVMLAVDDPGLTARIPEDIDGIPVRVEVTGDFTAGG